MGLGKDAICPSALCVPISLKSSTHFQGHHSRLINAFNLFVGIYLTCTMAITTLSMVLTVMVLNLHSISERPVPRWVRLIVLRHLARLFCIGTEEVETLRKDEKANHVKKKRKGVGRMAAALVEDEGEEHMPIIAINGTVNAGQGGQETSFVHMRGSSYANIRMNNNTSAFGEGTSSKTQDEKPDYSKEWHKLAEVVDRLFFWTFLLAIVAISILLFHPLTKSYLIKRPPSSWSRLILMPCMMQSDNISTYLCTHAYTETRLAVLSISIQRSGLLVITALYKGCSLLRGVG